MELQYMQQKPQQSRDTNWTRIGAVLLLVGAAVLAIRFAKPDVPSTITLLAGPKGSTFYQDGVRYREILAPYGVTVDLVATGGSVANLKQLVAGCGACVGFAEAVQYPEKLRGTGPNELATLGSLYVEPFWVFARRGLDVTQVTDLKGLAVAPGNKGSGVRIFAETLLAANGLRGSVTLVDAESTSATELRAAIESGKVDALFASGEPSSPLIEGLLRWPDFRPVSLRRIDSFTFRYPGIMRLRLPEGSYDMVLNIPDSDLDLIGLSVQLVVPTSLPAALSDLLLMAAGEIHGERGPFAKRGEFPNANLVSLPLSRAAVRYYERGPSPLWRVLPFRLATLVDRFMWVAASVASVALALFSILPKLLSFPYMRSSLGLYQRLERVEKSLGPEADETALLAELDDIERISATLHVPKSLRQDYLGLRQNIHDVRSRVHSL
jgi:TRAP transporter TAXI family solute receptor